MTIEEGLNAQLQYQRQKQMAMLSGETLPQRPAFLENVDRVISNAQKVEKALRGSEEERKVIRRVMHAACF